MSGKNGKKLPRLQFSTPGGGSNLGLRTFKGGRKKLERSRGPRKKGEKGGGRKRSEKRGSCLQTSLDRQKEHPSGL